MRHAAPATLVTVAAVGGGLAVDGHLTVGIPLALVGLLAVSARATVHQLRALRGTVRPGRRIRLLDGAVTPMDAARLENTGGWIGWLGGGGGDAGAGGGGGGDCGGGGGGDGGGC